MVHHCTIYSTKIVIFEFSGAPSGFVADIIFLVDTSIDVTPRQVRLQQEFIKEIGQHLNIRPGHSRASLVPYGTTAEVGLRFESYVTTAEFESAVDTLKPVGGQRRADRALEIAYNLVSDGRSKIPKIVVLLLAGNQDSQEQEVTNAIARISNLGANTYVIGKIFSSLKANLCTLRIPSLLNVRGNRLS